MAAIYRFPGLGPRVVGVPGFPSSPIRQWGKVAWTLSTLEGDLGPESPRGDEVIVCVAEALE